MDAADLERRWPDPDKGPYRLRVWFGKVEGRPAVVGVEMWGCEPVRRAWRDELEDVVATAEDGTPLRPPRLPLEGEAAITAAAIRLPLGWLLDWWVTGRRGLVRASRDLWGDLEGHEERARRFEARLGDERRTGRPRLSDEFLRDVARVYVEAQHSGDHRQPAIAVQRALNANTPATARSWIKRARKRGFLPPAQERPGT